MNNTDLQAQKTRLIEKLGVQFEKEHQLAPVAARIFATLIVTGKKGITFEQLVKDLNGLTEEQFLSSVESNFSIIPLIDPQPPNSSNNYSMFLNDRWYNLKTNNSLKSNDPIEGLDVSILQNHLLNPILGIGEETN